MSVPAWGHSDRLNAFLARPLIALAAILGAALEHEFAQDPEEDEAGNSDVGVMLVAALILCAFLVAAVRS